MQFAVKMMYHRKNSPHYGNSNIIFQIIWIVFGWFLVWFSKIKWIDCLYTILLSTWSLSLSIHVSRICIERKEYFLIFIQSFMMHSIQFIPTHPIILCYFSISFSCRRKQNKQMNVNLSIRWVSKPFGMSYLCSHLFAQSTSLRAMCMCACVHIFVRKVNNSIV